MRPPKSLCITLGLLALLPAGAASQDLLSTPTLDAPRLELPQVDASSAQPSALGPIVGGTLGGAVGLGVGLLPAAACDLEGSDCIGALVLLAAAESVGMALGAHLGNGRRGSFALDWLVAVVSGAAVLAIEENTATRGVDNGGQILLAGVVQLGAVVLTERATGRRR